MKEPISLIGQTDLTSLEMHEVAMQTVEPVSTIKTTERLVKNLQQYLCEVRF